LSIVKESTITLPHGSRWLPFQTSPVFGRIIAREVGLRRSSAGYPIAIPAFIEAGGGEQAMSKSRRNTPLASSSAFNPNIVSGGKAAEL